MLDLPGTYSLRARSPDEMVTRDVVLGQLEGETPPDVLVCVADATNLRLVLRLVLELKQVGRPMVLALNMFDIAERQGIRIDIEGLSQTLGIAVVTTVAVRKRGLEALLSEVDRLAGQAAGQAVWHQPSASDLREAHRNAERILKTYVKPPLRPDTFTGKLDGILLNPLAGTVILFAILFLMFQAVFTWATPAMDLIDASFTALGELVGGWVLEGLLQQLPGRRHHRRRRQRRDLPAADPDPVLLHHPAGRFRLYGPRRLPDGQDDGRGGPAWPRPSFRCSPASPAPFPASWRRG